jgi:hypothetical protein
MLRYTNIAILDKNEMRLKLEGVVNPKWFCLWKSVTLNHRSCCMYHVILRKVLMCSYNVFMRFFILRMNNSYYLEQIYTLEFVIETMCLSREVVIDS